MSYFLRHIPCFIYVSLLQVHGGAIRHETVAALPPEITNDGVGLVTVLYCISIQRDMLNCLNKTINAKDVFWEIIILQDIRNSWSLTKEEAPPGHGFD